MKISSGACAVALLLAAPLTVYAQNNTTKEPGWYGGLGAGYNSMADQGFVVDSRIPGGRLDHISADESAGYAFLINGGYDFGRIWYGGGVKLEGELAYRDNDVNKFKVNGSHRGGVDGDTAVETAIVNVINDFLPEDKVSPYIGIGVGYARLKYSNYGYTGRRITDDNGDAFVYQWIAGMRWDINSKASVTADYRYLHTANPGIRIDNGSSLQTDYLSHTIMVRFQYRP